MVNSSQDVRVTDNKAKVDAAESKLDSAALKLIELKDLSDVLDAKLVQLK
jgi:hypothetical protein